MNLQSLSIPFEMCWNIEQMNRLASSWGPCNQVEMFAAKDPDLRLQSDSFRCTLTMQNGRWLGLIVTLTMVYYNSYKTG